MKKQKLFGGIASLMLCLFATVAANAQCNKLRLTEFNRIWNSGDRENVLSNMGFSKRSGYFGRCKMEMCHTADSTSRNWNEFVFLYDDEVKYSFVDKTAYDNLLGEIKAKAKYVGFAVFDEERRTYYFDGKICYCIYIGKRDCLSMQITDYNLGFYDKVPSYVESENAPKSF